MNESKDVIAVFSPAQTLTVVKNNYGGTVNSDSGIVCGTNCISANQRVVQDSIIKLTATPKAGFVFTGWTGDGANCGANSICNVTMNISRTVRATFTAVYTLTVKKEGNGTGTVTGDSGIHCGSVAGCSKEYPAGTMVTLTATADPRSVFTGWSGGGCSGTLPCKVTMDTSKRVEAHFTRLIRLTFTTIGNGYGYAAPSPLATSCVANVCTYDYLPGTFVRLQAIPIVNGITIFGSWSGAVTGVGTTRYLALNSDQSVTATFVDVYTLEVDTIGGGTFTASSPGLGSGTSTHSIKQYPVGSVFTLTANPRVGWYFSGWTGGGCSGTGVCTLTLNASKKVVAHFELKGIR